MLSQFELTESSQSSDNEYEQWLGGEYFEDLKAVYNEHSEIVVPLTYNDPGQRKNFINGTVRRLLPEHLQVVHLLKPP